MSGAPQTVHLRVNDAATGKPTPVRVRITSHRAGGMVDHAPLGRLAAPPTGWGESVGGSVLLDGATWHYIDGQCEILLPSGPLRVSIAKGPFYRPVTQETRRREGQISLRFSIEPLADPRDENWFATDCRAHFLSPFAACLEGAAEGLDLVHVLAAQWERAGRPFLANLLEFSGQSPALSQYGCQVAVNTYNRGGEQGDLSLLHCHRAVFPLVLGEPFQNYRIADWCGQCHRKGGLVVWSNFETAAGERLSALEQGGIDALEWSPGTDTDTMLRSWYGLLSAGRLVPLVGSSGKADNARQLGVIRTYARLLPNEPFTLDNWVQAVKAGRTVASRGPLIQFTITGAGAVCASAQGMLPGDRLAVVHGGAVVAETESDEHGAARIEALISADSGWAAARCERKGVLLAHTAALAVSPRHPQAG